MPNGLEVERKWVVSSPSDDVLATTTSAEPIDQGYLTIGEGGAETRIRRRAGHHILTVKSGQGLVRNERSVELTAAQFDALWPATEGARVEKTRHLIPCPGNAAVTIELDIYTGALTGLAVAEVEFVSADAAAAFNPPSWFGAEVTDDRRYKNQSLATSSTPVDRS